MRFERALEENPAPRGVGDIRLWYEGSLLVGETARSSRLVSSALFVTGLGSALGCLAMLMLSGADGLGVAIAFGAVAAALVSASMFAEQRARARRRFVLNFADETLRVDQPSRRGAPRTTVVSFDDVRDVSVVGGPGGGYRLEVRWAQGAQDVVTAVLVDAVLTRDVEALRRLWKTLRTAFGLEVAVG